MILPLGPAQALFDKTGRVNLIVVSNRGDEVAGERLSEEVTRELRVLFADREVASQLKELLNQEPRRSAYGLYSPLCTIEGKSYPSFTGKFVGVGSNPSAS